MTVASFATVVYVVRPLLGKLYKHSTILDNRYHANDSLLRVKVIVPAHPITGICLYSL